MEPLSSGAIKNTAPAINTNQINLYEKVFDIVCTKGLDVNIKELLQGNPSIPFSLANKFISKLQTENMSEKLKTIFLELYCEGFTQKKFKEQIDYTKQRGEQASFAEHLVDSGRYADLIEHFKEFDFDPQTKLVICKKIASIGYNVVTIHGLFQNIDKTGILDIPIDQRLQFYKELIHIGNGVPAWNFPVYLDKLGLEEATSEQRLEIGQEILKKAASIPLLARQIAGSLAKNFNKLDLKTPEQRLTFSKEIAKYNPSSLAYHFDKLELEDPMVEEMCRLIIDQGEKKAVARNLAKIPLDPNKKVELWKEIARSLEIDIEFSNTFNKNTFENAHLPVDDRLAIYKILVKRGPMAAMEIANHITKLDLEDATPELRMNFYNEIAEQGGDIWHSSGWDAIQALAQHLKDGLGDVSLDGRLAFYKQIKNKGFLRALCANFDNIGLEETTLEQRLSLCHEIAKYNAAGLAFNIDKVDLKEATIEQCLALCYEIIRNGGSHSLVSKARNFDKFDLKKATLEQRLDLCHEMIKHNCAYSVAENIGKFHLKEATLEQRLDLCYQIIKNNGAADLAENIEKFNLKEATLEQSLVLCYETIKNNGADDLARNIDKFDLKEATLDQRLDLCYQIIKKNGAQSLARDIDKFNLNEATPEQRLDLVYEIIKNNGADGLARNFDKFDLKDATLELRLALCHEILKNNGADGLANNIEKFHLENAPTEALQKLGKEIIMQGKAKTLMVNLHKFPIKDSEELLSLVALISFLGQNVGIIFPSYITDPSMQRRVHLDLGSRPPDALWGPLVYTARVFFDNGTDNPAFHPVIEEYFPFLKDILKNICTKTEFLQPALRKWVSYTACIINDLNLTLKQMEDLNESHIFNTIYEHFNITNRYAFVRGLRDMIQSFPGDISKLSAEKKSWVPLSVLLCSSLKSAGLTEKTANELLECIKGTPGFKDTNKFNSIVQFIRTVLAFGPYKQNEMESIATSIIQVLSQKRGKQKKDDTFTQKQIDITAGYCAASANIMQIFGKEKLLECLSSKQDPKVFFRDRFSTLFTLVDQTNFQENYQKTFDEFRDPMALFTYLRAVNQLPAEEKAAVKTTLNNYVNAVLQGKKNFREVRYDTANSPHLAKIFQERPGIKELWLDKKPSKVVSTGAETADQGIDYEKMLREKIIADKHLDNDKFPLLCNFLSGKEEPVLEKTDTEEVKFQRLAINLCKGKIDAKKFVKAVKSLKQISLGEFENDLEALIPKVSAGQYQIEETDDPCDLLLIGTEIQGSCQRVDGTPRLNKCLAAYLMNGEIRAIAVKQGGKLVARSMMRLLWDEKNKTPVLLQERRYSNVSNPDVEKAIDEWAKAKAKDLGIKLVRTEIGSGPAYDGTVEFFGGATPFTYSDASGGIQSGPFKTKGCHLVG